MGAQRIHPGPVSRLVANLRIQLGRVRDVVSVQASWYSFQIIRRVTMRDAQTGEIVDERGRGLEGEASVELQAISRGWKRGRAHRRFSTTTKAVPSCREGFWNVAC